MPWYLSGNPVVFNPELFTQAGLDPNAPPETWDELLAAWQASEFYHRG